MALPFECMPLFVSTLRRTIRLLSERFPSATLVSGDLIVTNDPWLAAGHKSDLVLVAPVFHDGRHVAFVGTILHVADIGGTLGDFRAWDIFEEGLALPPLKLCEAGAGNRVVFDLIAANVRSPELVLGDLAAMRAAIDVASPRIISLLEVAPGPRLDTFASEVRGRATHAFRQAMAAIPEGRHSAQLDCYGIADASGCSAPIRVAVRIDAWRDGLVIDFAGSARERPREPINVPISYTWADTLYGFQYMLAPRIPNVGPQLSPIDVVAQAGCILNARPPVPVFARRRTGMHIATLVNAALAPALPGHVQAGCGHNVIVKVASRDEAGRYVHETVMPEGGMGAVADRDGWNCTAFPTTCTMIATEVAETICPILVDRRMRVDSGGPGRCRGGLGQDVTIRSVASFPLILNFRPSFVSHPPPGLLGGQAGAAAAVGVNGRPRPRATRWSCTPVTTAASRRRGVAARAIRWTAPSSSWLPMSTRGWSASSALDGAMASSSPRAVPVPTLRPASGYAAVRGRWRRDIERRGRPHGATYTAIPYQPNRSPCRRRACDVEVDAVNARGTPTLPFTRYLDFADMSGALRELAGAYPHLATLRSIGQSHQGRDIWLVEITNPDTGPAEHKPGYYLDAQIHAEEHATSAVALYAVHHLLTRYGGDEQVTRLLDEQAFYVIPRVNPDGAEFSLQRPYHLWCGNGRYVPGREREFGLTSEDVDGDGYVASMRVEDPAGEWRKSDLDERVMVQRRPGEHGGTYYRLYPEGFIDDFDGVHVSIARPRDGNLNRNFPANWEAGEYGAGEHPLSEPETAAVARFILDHPNIAGMNAYHTHGGIILRPSMTRADSAMSPRDLALFQALGEVGTALTGYPTISIYEEFTPDKTAPRRGGLMDWTYETMGIPSFATEVWDIESAAGVEKTSYLNFHPRTEEAQLAVFRWVLEHVGDRGYRPWRAFDHPHLGPLEVGGMVYVWTYRNPPPSMLEDICRANVMFNLEHASAAPRIRIDDLRAEPLGGGLYRVRTVVKNHGYLPTNLTDVALQQGVAEPVRVRLEADGAELVMNPAEVVIGHLAGRNERTGPWSPWGQQWTPAAAAVEWLVRTSDPQRCCVSVVALSERAGRDRSRLHLGSDE